MKLKLQSLLILSLLFFSCKEQEHSEEITSFENKGHELVYEMVQKVGNYSKLAEKKDVVYTYKYQTPDGKTDLSTEKYIFDGELSYGAYEQHERTLPQYEGLIEQGYDGKAYWLRHKGNYIQDAASLQRVTFNRPTNFYWFTMFQKLLDPGLTYEYLGEKNIEDKNYEVVKISFDSYNEKPTDIYQIYINKDTKLVDQFLFTVAEVGVVDQPLLMKLEYEEIEGLLIPTQRIYKGSNWEAEVTNAPWIKVNWSNIQFNNGLSRSIFEK